MNNQDDDETVYENIENDEQVSKMEYDFIKLKIIKTLGIKLKAN